MSAVRPPLVIVLGCLVLGCVVLALSGGAAAADLDLMMPYDEPGWVDPFIDYPQRADEYVPYTDPGYMDRSLLYLLKQQRTVSRVVTRFGQSMDAYFAGPYFFNDADSNDTYLLIQSSQRWEEADGIDPEFDVKFRVDLPATKERYRLVLQYQDEEDEESLEERTRSSRAIASRDNQSFLAGLVRTLSDESGRWEGKISGGIKVKIPPDPFIRSRASRFIKVGGGWDLELRGDAQWRNSRGLHTQFDIIFDRQLDTHRLLRVRSMFDWRDEVDQLELGQLFSLYRQVSLDLAMEYQIGAFGRSLTAPSLDTYYASVRYRWNGYREWLFLNVIPEAAWERWNGFETVLSLTAGAEIYFR